MQGGLKLGFAKHLVTSEIYNCRLVFSNPVIYFGAVASKNGGHTTAVNSLVLSYLLSEIDRA